MTGVSIVQWRGIIGIFDRKKIKKSIQKLDTIPISDHLLNSFCLLKPPKILKILFSLILLFLYCTMIVTLFPILLMFAIFMEFLFTSVNRPRSIQFNPLFKSPVKIFFGLHTIPRSIKYLLTCSFIKYKNLIFFFTVLQILLFISGTVEVNLGPDKSKKTNLSFAVWNLDSIPARDFARIPLIETLQATYDFDIFGVCESFLNNDISNEDILIRGFSPDPFQADKPVNTRNGGVCLYFKENWPIKERIDLEIIPETIIAEVKLNRKKIYFVLSYCHPNLSSTEYDLYVKSIEQLYERINKVSPAVTILTGDFNAQSPLYV